MAAAAALAAAGPVHGAASWVSIDSLDPGSPAHAVAAHPQDSAYVAAATRTGVYLSSDEGRSWALVRRLSPLAVPRAIAMGAGAPPLIAVMTSDSAAVSADGGRHWSAAFRPPAGEGDAPAACTAIAVHPRRNTTLLLGTNRGMYLTTDAGTSWRRVGIPPSAGEVLQAAFDSAEPDRAWVLGRGGLWFGSWRDDAWRRLDVSDEPEENADGEEADQRGAGPLGGERASLPLLRTLAVAPSGSAVYLMSPAGLNVTRDHGRRWERRPALGLDAGTVRVLLASLQEPHGLIAATARDIAAAGTSEARWSRLEGGLAGAEIHDLAVAPGVLWAATARGLFRRPAPGGEVEPPPAASELLRNFLHEPTAAEVQAAAVRYAEVSPEKIARWRRQARLQGLLPSVSVGLDRDRDTFITSRGSTSDPETDRIIIAEDPSRSFDVSVNWDLGELIWNDDQTSIDVRAKLMVQLRNDIVDQVTRLYFERRQTQLAMLLEPEAPLAGYVERELRLQELTAQLDGLTGGFFSDKSSFPAQPHREDPDGATP
ncbi:MAG TPA: hypothetical protein VGB20_05710 [bacterium]